MVGLRVCPGEQVGVIIGCHPGWKEVFYFLFLITFQGSLDRIVGSIFFFFRAQLDFLGWCFAQTLISLFPDLFPAASAALVVGGPRSHVY